MAEIAKVLGSPSGAAFRDLAGVHSPLAFFGDPTQLALSGRVGTDDVMDHVKERFEGRTKYLRPGDDPDELRISGLPDLSVFVLGPPRDRKFIRKSRPSSRHQETYLHAPTRTYLKMSGAGFQASSDHAANIAPFNPRYQMEYDETELYGQPGLEWRQIGSSFSDELEDLALRLDAHTNNTSLVLAFELEKDGRVLLFPGDAQVGNWLSWSSVKWKGDRPDIGSDDLLARTVFYKVGHHASHNATLKEEGLEKMTHEDLAAFIPLDRQMAQKQRWTMPHPELFERLHEQTEGRVYISDGLDTPSQDVNFTEHTLYYEYDVA